MKEYYFEIYKQNPTELLIEEKMTFKRARKVMDINATQERPITYRVLNELYNAYKWEDGNFIHKGGRKVYDKEGNLGIITPDYANIWKPNSCRFYVWEEAKERHFIEAFSTEELANEYAERLRNWNKIMKINNQITVEPCDVKTDE